MNLPARVVTVAQYVQTGSALLGERAGPGRGPGARRVKLDDLKAFMESLQAFNTPGKLKNFNRSVANIQRQQPNLDLVKQIDDLNGLVQELTPLTGYLYGCRSAAAPRRLAQADGFGQGQVVA